MHSRSNGQFSVVTAGTVVANIFQLIDGAGNVVGELGQRVVSGVTSPALLMNTGGGGTGYLGWRYGGLGVQYSVVLAGPGAGARLTLGTSGASNSANLTATNTVTINSSAGTLILDGVTVNIGSLYNVQQGGYPIVGVHSGIAAARPGSGGGAPAPTDGGIYHETDSKRRTYQFHQASGNWRTLGDIDDTWNISTGAVSFGFSTLNITDQFQYRRIWGTTLEWECEFTLTGVPNPGLLIIVSPVPPASIGLNVGHPVGSAVLLDSGLSRRLGVVIADAAVPTWFSINDPAAGGLNLWNSATNNPITYGNVDGLVAAGRFRCLAG
jgi:hypothetical protein